MKKLFSVMLALTIFSAIFISCSKDNENPSPSNSVTIQGEFIVGEKTFSNPMFDLGAPDDLSGYLTNYSKAQSYNTIVIEDEYIDLGNNFMLDFNMNIYSITPGDSISMYMSLQVYENLPAKNGGLYIYSNDVKAEVTKVGDVGGYIEGTYEGDFFYSNAKSEAPFHLIGKFKVKRIEQIPL